MGKSGQRLTTDERLQILRAAAHISSFGEHRELTDIARQYAVSLTTVKRILRDSISRAVAILEPDNRVTELVEASEHGS